jgi:hypothetical protein
VIKQMVVAIYGSYPGDWVRGGALYGGSTAPQADSPRFWLPLRQDHEPHALFWAKNVPDKLAKRIEGHGISGEQFYSDGYEGLHAIAPYLAKEPFYESPEEWQKEKDREQRAEAGEYRRPARRASAKKRASRRRTSRKPAARRRSR